MTPQLSQALLSLSSVPPRPALSLLSGQVIINHMPNYPVEIKFLN